MKDKPIRLIIPLSVVIILCVSSILKSQNFIRQITLPSSEFKRIAVEPGTFAQWLRELPLKAPGTDVLNYRGGIFKTGTDTAVAAVVDWDISGRRLEQCMDIVVRFYAEYIWEKNKGNELSLPLPGGYWLAWVNWKQGYRPIFKGIDVQQLLVSKPDSRYYTFNKYLNTIFSASYTQQFYHAYQVVERKNVKIGDFIIKKGTKGHTVMIVDLAQNDTGDLIALIGNGDTPACQFFLLKSVTGDPWIRLKFDQENIDLPLKTKMSWDGLRRFDLPKLK